MSDDHLCAKCARAGKTCCQTSEIYVTPGDARRITEYTHRPAEDYCEFRYPCDPIYLNAHDDDPIWLVTVIRQDQNRRVLKRRDDGDCSFLGERGCTLPVEVRPLVCRLYPYDFNEQGIKPQLAHGCPTELMRPGITLLQELDMNIDDARRWHGMLYEEIREEPHARLPEADSSPSHATSG